MRDFNPVSVLEKKDSDCGVGVKQVLKLGVSIPNTPPRTSGPPPTTTKLQLTQIWLIDIYQAPT